MTLRSKNTQSRNKVKNPAKKKAVKRPAKKAVTYLLRTCDANLRAHNGFQWPAKGAVKCPNPNKRPECGGGLHGLLMGEGDARLLNWSSDAKWLVVKVLEADVIKIDGEKVKVPKGEVVYSGDRLGATSFIIGKGADPCKCVGGFATAGDSGTATAGDSGTATAGDSGTATAGYSGTATAGDYGTATAGDSGTATAGYSGTATAGDYGTATAGDYGTLIIRWYDGNRYRRAIGYVGEDGIEANVPYRVLNGKLARKS